MIENFDLHMHRLQQPAAAGRFDPYAEPVANFLLTYHTAGGLPSVLLFRVSVICSILHPVPETSPAHDVREFCSIARYNQNNPSFAPPPLAFALATIGHDPRQTNMAVPAVPHLPRTLHENLPCTISTGHISNFISALIYFSTSCSGESSGCSSSVSASSSIHLGQSRHYGVWACGADRVLRRWFPPHE